MIQFESENRIIRETLTARFKNLEKAAEIDTHVVEFDDVRYHIHASAADAQHMTVSIAVPPASSDAAVEKRPGGVVLPAGATDAVVEAYSSFGRVLEEPEKSYDLTLELDLTKLPPDQGEQLQLASRLSALRSVVMCAPLRKLLGQLVAGGGPSSASLATTAGSSSQPVALLQRPRESYYVIDHADKMTVVFPMRFRDANDVTLAVAFLQEFMEARRTGGQQMAPPCSYSDTPPMELKGLPAAALQANAGFVSFVIFPRHVEGPKLERVAWALSTFYAYVSYHIKCSKAFMHTRMRRRVDLLIQLLNRAKPDVEKEKKTASGRTFVRQATKARTDSELGQS